MKAELADYILCLSESASNTRNANDRPLYLSYLADAAVLLALLVRGANVEDVKGRIQDHERLLGQTFLAGPEHKAVDAAWERFKGYV